MNAELVSESTRSERGPVRAPTERKTVASRPASTRGVTLEWVLFWTFVAGLAWTPYWYGGNSLFAWGVNAILFPGLVIVYEGSILAKGERHPVGLKELWLPAVLFVSVVLWIVIQNSTRTPLPWHHPIWAMAADALRKPMEGSISVNRDLTTLALLRLITAASVFWLAVQLCRNASRANYFITAIVTMACGYSAYGLISYALTPGSLHWMGQTVSIGFVNSTFVNRIHFAIYASIGLVAVCAQIVRRYRREIAMTGGSLRFRIASIIEATAHKGAVLIAAAFLMLVAILLTGSRGAIGATGLGLLTLGLLLFGGRHTGAAGGRGVLVFGALAFAAIFLAFGNTFVGEIFGRGFSDENRAAVYMIALRSIMDSPLLGYGYGTFVDVFPMFRDRSISVDGVWEEAHNTYLEVFQGLGLVFGAMLVACVVILVWKCFKTAVARREGMTAACVATSVACLVGVHSLLDFSLQIQAVTLTLMAVLGAGVAQSDNSQAIRDN